MGRIIPVPFIGTFDFTNTRYDGLPLTPEQQNFANAAIANGLYYFTGVYATYPTTGYFLAGQSNVYIATFHVGSEQFGTIWGCNSVPFITYTCLRQERNGDIWWFLTTNSRDFYSESGPGSISNCAISLNDLYANRAEAEAALRAYIMLPITYRLTNCTAPTAPTEAAIGNTVTVPFQFPSGYGFVNPSLDVYVTNNGVVVPSQYSNGILTFTMPDQS